MTSTGKVRVFDHSIDNQINASASIADLALAEQAVLAGQPQHFASRLGKIENQRAKILATSEPVEAAIADWLAQLLWLIESVELSSGRVGTEWDPFADPPRYPDAVFSRALARGRECTHPVGRLVWLRAVWSVRRYWQKRAAALGLPRGDELARECARSAADAADWHVAAADAVSEHRTMMAVYCWKVTFDSLRDIKDVGLTQQLLPRARACLNALVGEDDLWAIRLLGHEVGLYASGKEWRPLVDDARIADMRSVAVKLDDGVAARGFTMSHMREELVDVIDKIGSLDGASLTQKEKAARRAEIGRQSAESHPSALVRAALWEDVAGEYQQAGDAASAAAAMEKSRREVAAAIAAGDFKALSVEHQIPAERVKRELAPFFDGATSAAEVLVRASGVFFVPWFDDPKSRVLPRGFVSQVLPRVAVVGDRIQAAQGPTADGTPAEWEAHDAIRMQLSLGSALLLAPLMEDLAERFDDVDGDVVSFFCGSDAILDADVPLLVRAITEFFAGDFVTLMHVLPARLEQLVHRTIKARGGSVTTRLPAGGLQERTFGALIEQARSSELMPVDVADYVDAVLTKEWGLNIRNNVAHGWIDASGFDAPLAARLLHVALVLLRWSMREAK